MNVAQTKQHESNQNPELFAFTDLTAGHLELIQESLITYKSLKLQDPEAFKDDRQNCIDMYQKIDAALIKSRS